MKIKKLLSFVLVFSLLLSLLLTGCGSPKADPDKDAQSTKESESTMAATSEVQKLEPVTLKFLTYKVGNDQGEWPNVIKKFEEANSNIKVEVDSISDGYNDVIKTRLAAGEGPDAFLGWVQDCTLYEQAGYIADLTDQPFAGNLNDIPKKLVSVNDKVCALPIDLAGVGLFSNMDILEKNSLSIPTNWGEFLDACKELKEANVLPFITGHKTGWTAGAFYLAGSAPVTRANPDIGVQIYDGKQKISELLLPMLTKYKTLADNGYINAKESLGMEFSEQTFTDFANGKAAFMLAGTWQVKQLKEANKDMKFSFSAFPVQDSGAPIAVIFPGSTLFVNKASKHIADAYGFVNFVAQNENLGMINKQQSAFSTLKGGSGADDPEVANYASSVKAGDMGYQLDIGMKGFSPWEEYTKGCQLLIIGKAAPEEIAQSVDRSLEKFLAQTK